MTSYATKIIICSREATEFFPQISKLFARFGMVSRDTLFAACAFREIVKASQNRPYFLADLLLLVYYLFDLASYAVMLEKKAN
jgi:hypothetical protein